MRKSGLLFALSLIVACKGDGGVGPLVTTTVAVTSSATQIAVNETAQATALVKDQNGNPLTGKTVEWSSLNPAVASVTPAGLIRGVAPGSSTIQGKVDGIIGSAAIIVIVPSTACVSGPTTVDLAVGAVRVLSAAATSGCIKLAQSPAATDYIVIAANANQVPDELPTYVIKSDEGEVVPNTTLLATPSRIIASLSVPAETLSPQLAFERGLRRIEREQLHIPDAQRAWRGSGLESPLRYSVSVAIPVVGEKTQFKVPKSCSNFTTITATVQYISNRSIIYTDDTSPSGGFTSTDFQQIGDEFDSLIYPTDVSLFGNPLDLDNNQRVIILYTPEVNKLTPSGMPNSFVGGFFFAGDLFPSSGSNSCAQSNVAEVFYALSPDPAGAINGNVRSTSQVRQGTRGTIAHELEHMINASERIRSPIAQEFEDVWLDEALAHFAEDYTGRVLRGIGDSENADFTRLSTNISDFNAFFFQNFARLQRYLQNPGPNAPTSQFSDSSLADRGAAWALLRYTADHYAPGGDIKAFTKALAGGPNTGVNNLMTRIGGGVPFDTLIAGWMVANFADDAGIPGLASKYTYNTYNMRSNVSAITASRTYPLVINVIQGGAFVSNNLSARSASGNYFRVTRSGGAPARSIRFLNEDGRTSASFTGATYYVLRVQ